MARRPTRSRRARSTTGPDADVHRADSQRRMLAQALAAIPDCAADDWTVAVFSGSGQPQPPRDLHDRLERVFLTWAWHGGYRTWFGGVRAVARALRGLEEAGLLVRQTARRPGTRPRRTWTLTEDGQAVAKALSRHGGKTEGA